jgi:hypothetical protein
VDLHQDRQRDGNSLLSTKTGWAIAREKGLSALVSTINGGATWSLLKPVIAK